MVVKTEQH